MTLEQLIKRIERDYPSFLVDIKKEQATNDMVITVFNANRFSNTAEPHKEKYSLASFRSLEELLDKIKQDFTYEK